MIAGQTGLVALIIPGWAQDGGRAAMLKRFADPALRERIVREAEEAMDKRFGGPGSVYFPATRQDLTTVMQSMQVRLARPWCGCSSRATTGSSRGSASKRTS